MEVTGLLEAHIQGQGLSLCTNLVHSRSNKAEDLPKLKIMLIALIRNVHCLLQKGHEGCFALELVCPKFRETPTGCRKVNLIQDQPLTEVSDVCTHGKAACHLPMQHRFAT